MTYHFPDAYAGQNTKMCASPALQSPFSVPLRSSAHPDALVPRSRDTLNNLITKYAAARRRPRAVGAHSRTSARSQVAPGLADRRRPALLRDHGHGHRVGRDPLRRPPHVRSRALDPPRSSRRSRPPPLRVAGSACRTRACRACVRDQPLKPMIVVTERAPLTAPRLRCLETSLRRRHRDRVVRRGLGLVIESDVRSPSPPHCSRPLSRARCRASVLRDRRRPRALRQPAQVHPLRKRRLQRLVFRTLC